MEPTIPICYHCGEVTMPCYDCLDTLKEFSSRLNRRFKDHNFYSDHDHFDGLGDVVAAIDETILEMESPALHEYRKLEEDLRRSRQFYGPGSSLEHPIIEAMAQLWLTKLTEREKEYLDREGPVCWPVVEKLK